MRRGPSFCSLRSSAPKPIRVCGAFTLVETLVAVAILAMGLTAVLGLLSFMLRTMRVTANQLVAAHLAAEGIEVIRNLRDANWLIRDCASCAGHNPARGWRDGLADGSYEVQYDTELPLPVWSAPGRLLQNDTDGRYCYGCATLTPFRRKVEITSSGLDATKQMRIVVTVSWQDAFLGREAAVEDVLYDWK